MNSGGWGLSKGLLVGWVSTAHGNGSISENATGCQSSGFHATVAASMPENMLTYFIGVSFLEFAVVGEP